MQPSVKLVPNPVCVLREEFDEWALLYNPDTAVAVGLNPTAVTTWKLLDGRLTAAEVAEAVVSRYAGTPADAGREVLELLDALADGGFVGPRGG